MTGKKGPRSHNGESNMSPELADMLSKQLQSKEKSEQQQYPKEDKRKVAREEHTNGSTLSKRS